MEVSDLNVSIVDPTSVPIGVKTKRQKTILKFECIKSYDMYSAFEIADAISSCVANSYAFFRHDPNQMRTYGQVRFLYKGIIIKHNKTEPTYTKTSLFLCEKRRFLWPGLRKEGNLFKLAGPGGLAFFHLTKKEVSKWPMKK